MERNTTALAVKPIVHQLWRGAVYGSSQDVASQYICIQCDVRNIRVLFTLEFLHFRVLKDMVKNRQTINGEVSEPD